MTGLNRTGLKGTGSRRWYRSASVLSLAAVLSVIGVAAQSAGPPLPLTSQTPADAAGQAAGAGAPSPPPDPHTVAVDTLAAPKPDSMGLVDSTGGGFSDALWHGTPGATARVLVARLPHRYVVPAVRHLAQRFLLSAASPDVSPALGPDGNPNGGAMLEARIDALAAMADWDDVLALIDLVPTETRSPHLVRTRINGLLAKGRIDPACGDGAHASSQSPDVYWQKLQILCQLVAGQNSPAAVGLELLREQGNDDKLFFWAIDILQGNDSPPPADLSRPDGTVDPLILAILRRAGYLLPASIVDAGDPTVLTFAAQTALAPPPSPPPPDDAAAQTSAKEKRSAARRAAAEKASAAEKAARLAAAAELRLSTVERAVAVGVADPEALRTAYAALDLHDDQAVSTDSIAVDSARQRAATFQLALAQTVPASRAEVIARVLDLTRLKTAGNGPDVVTTALIYRPLVAGLPVNADLLWFAGTAVRIVMVADSVGLPSARSGTAGSGDNAKPWIELLQGGAATSKDAAATLSGLWPYLRLAQFGPAMPTPEEMAAWQATLPADRALEQRAALFDLLTGVGDNVAAAEWQSIVAASAANNTAMAGIPASGTPPSFLLWDALSLAAKEGHVGEAVALTLQFLGADHGAPVHLAVTKALESLTAVGRTGDARAIATELALARGL